MVQKILFSVTFLVMFGLSSCGAQKEIACHGVIFHVNDRVAWFGESQSWIWNKNQYPIEITKNSTYANKFHHDWEILWVKNLIGGEKMTDSMHLDVIYFVSVNNKERTGGFIFNPNSSAQQQCGDFGTK